MENSNSRRIDHTCDYIVQNIYKTNQNFIIKETNRKSKICIIFFSGNGLYFPNEEAEFFDKIIKNNRYEWQNISNDKVFEKKAGKIIFVRDVHKQWYVEGISEEYNSVDKTVQLLKSLTDGYEIVTVGNSAGGYAAVLFGCLLNAEKVFTISGQFFFTNKEVFETEKLLIKHRTEEKYSQYYDLRNIVKNFKGVIFYIFPCKSEQDILQYKHIEDLSNIIKIRINSDVHGTGLLPENYKFVIFKNTEKLIKKMVSDKEFSQSELFRRTISWYTIFYLRAKYEIVKRIKWFLKKIRLFYIIKKLLRKA